jgi:hypothetical protein
VQQDSGAVVRCTKLTNEELWRAIARNTETMASLLHQDGELDTSVGDTGDANAQAETKAKCISVLDWQYRAYSAELRRRYR